MKYVSATGMALVLCLSTKAPMGAEDCPFSSYYPGDRIDTPDFALEATSASGAVGDVVAVTFFFRVGIDVPGRHAFIFAVCHDTAVADLEGDPVFSEELEDLADTVMCDQVDEDLGLPVPQVSPVGHGLHVYVSMLENKYSQRFPSDVPVPLMTAYYRLKGTPGDTGQVTFCDGALAFGAFACEYNHLFVRLEDYPATPYRYYVSSSRVPSTLTVLEGPATHPDRPPEPPRAKVYPQLPSQEEVNFTVEIQGTAARPGDQEVPVEVYASADVEYSAIEIPVDFDERYLRLARAECHITSGVVLIDNFNEEPGAEHGEGNAVIFSGIGVSTRRIALEGEKVHVGTLYFDVGMEAAAIESTSFDVVTVTRHLTPGANYPPWVGVHYERTIGTEITEVKEQISPVQITTGILRILPEVVIFVRGDSNFDRSVNISDPVSTLGFLFLGTREPFCMDAADANDDGRLDVSDPIFTLNALFLGGVTLPPPYPEEGDDLTPDLLGCY